MQLSSSVIYRPAFVDINKKFISLVDIRRVLERSGTVTKRPRPITAPPVTASAPLRALTASLKLLSNSGALFTAEE